MKKTVILWSILVITIFISACSPAKQESDNIADKGSGDKFKGFSAEVYCASYKFSIDGNLDQFNKEILNLGEKYGYAQDEANGLVGDHQYDMGFQRIVLEEVRKKCPDAAPSFEDRIEQLEQESSSGNQDSGLSCQLEGRKLDSKLYPNLECCGNLQKSPVYELSAKGRDSRWEPVENIFVCIDCPNGICGQGEFGVNCPEDCGYMCGNNRCEPGETHENCSVDCS